MGKNANRMYDRLSLMMRIETTTNDVTFFKIHRWVEQRSGETSSPPCARPSTASPISPGC